MSSLVACIEDWLKEANLINWEIVEQSANTMWLQHKRLEPVKKVAIPHYYIDSTAVQMCCNEIDDTSFNASDPELFKKLEKHMARKSDEYIYAYTYFVEEKKNVVRK